MANVLSTDLRNKLERVIIDARDIAEEGAKAALDALGVPHHEAFPHMNQAQRALRTHLRARARQIGDQKDSSGNLNPVHLIQECAYEHWHRMLFARFLAENNLLIESESNVAISIDECKELAKDEGVDLWVLASRYAQKMLPQIFRPDDPLLQISLPREYSVKLEVFVNDLDTATFLASDALGWVYQFWQSKRKKQVNESGKKIGADEISAVTQLFTEPYMVQFLLHNTIGAWWAGKVLARNQEISAKAATEEELRKAVSLPGVNWEYLRFIKTDDGKGSWAPAAGTFSGWPQNASQLKILDPCCGSGHFIVALFFVMIAIRQAEENFGVKDACDAVLRDNLHGLEIDERCTQIAAFALALSAWSLPDAGGFRKLPEFHIACSGIAPSVKKSEWVALARNYVNSLSISNQGDLFPEQKNELWHEPFERGMEALYELFEKAPILGSLIDPTKIEGSFFQADFGQLTDLLQDALSKEKSVVGDETHEMAVAAWGLAKAAELLGQKYHLVITNVPYLTSAKQNDILKKFALGAFPDSRSNLATIFIERSLQLCKNEGQIAFVTPQDWIFLSAYRVFRTKVLKSQSISLLVKLGTKSFQTPMWDFNTMLIAIERKIASTRTSFTGIDVSAQNNAGMKSLALPNIDSKTVLQNWFLKDPDSRIDFEEISQETKLGDFADSWQGIVTCDDNRFLSEFWSIDFSDSKWETCLQPPKINHKFEGRREVIRWDSEKGALHNASKAHNFPPLESLNRMSVCVQRMNPMNRFISCGEIYGDHIAPLVPKRPEDLPAIWMFTESGALIDEVKKIDQQNKIAIGSFLRVPFDVKYWSSLASTKYPNGLPEPYSDDPTQWIFHGRPEQSTSPLHVAVARLLGYRWPAEFEYSESPTSVLPVSSSEDHSQGTDETRRGQLHGQDARETSRMRLSTEARELVAKCEELLPFVDQDGIVGIPSIRGEEPAADRLRALLAKAYGAEYTHEKELSLIAATGSTAPDLDTWLRNDFFEQHCKLFHHRPFIWHIWDGRARDGFNVLVNYHKLAEGNGKGRRLFDTLIYSYLFDWINRQKDELKREIGGADDRLTNAMELQKRLKLIAEGESPYDIFVRWKPLDCQAIGWEPDINDGVRLNIRPFMQPFTYGKSGAGILRWKPNINWNKDRGTEPKRTKEDYPWFWKGNEFTGERVNDVHLDIETKQQARKTVSANSAEKTSV
jgi:hypothetical protein